MLERVWRKWNPFAMVGIWIDKATIEKYACMGAKLLQLCLTLWDSMDYSPPGSSVHGILQSRMLERVSMTSSRGSCWPRNWTCVSCIYCIAGRFFTTEPPRKPGEQCRGSLKKLKIELPWDPAVLLLGIYPEKTIIQKDICSPMFNSALFTIARIWNQPKCPSTE